MNVMLSKKDAESLLGLSGKYIRDDVEQAYRKKSNEWNVRCNNAVNIKKRDEAALMQRKLKKACDVLLASPGQSASSRFSSPASGKKAGSGTGGKPSAQAQPSQSKKTAGQRGKSSSAQSKGTPASNYGAPTVINFSGRSSASGRFSRKVHSVFSSARQYSQSPYFRSREFMRLCASVLILCFLHYLWQDNGQDHSGKYDISDADMPAVEFSGNSRVENQSSKITVPENGKLEELLNISGTQKKIRECQEATRKAQKKLRENSSGKSPLRFLKKSFPSEPVEDNSTRFVIQPDNSSSSNECPPNSENISISGKVREKAACKPEKIVYAGQLKVKTFPASKVFINNRFVGWAPFTPDENVPLNPGLYTLKLVNSIFGSVEKKFVMEQKAEKELNYWFDDAVYKVSFRECSY